MHAAWFVNNDNIVNIDIFRISIKIIPNIESTKLGYQWHPYFRRTGQYISIVTNCQVHLPGFRRREKYISIVANCQTQSFTWLLMDRTVYLNSYKLPNCSINWLQMDRMVYLNSYKLPNCSINWLTYSCLHCTSIVGPVFRTLPSVIHDIIEKLNLQITSFSRFWIKITDFSNFLSKFQAFSRPGKVNDKIPGFQGFPGSVGTLLLVLYTGTRLYHNTGLVASISEPVFALLSMRYSFRYIFSPKYIKMHEV